jgi:predicted phage terminase large subunit-like protein
MVDQAETEALKTLKLGPYAYAGQYQQTPTPRAGMVLDPGWIVPTPRLQPATVDIIMAWDLNYSSKDASDWTVGLVAAVDKDPVLPRIHLVDLFRHHLASQQHAQVIADWIGLWRPLLVGIERRAFEQQGATQDLIRQITILLDQMGVVTTLEPVEADTDKLSRAMIIPGRAKAGLITANLSASWWSDLSHEMSSFPKGTHDDIVDTLAYLVRLAVEKLSSVRSQQMLLGHSAAIKYVQAPAQSHLDPSWASLIGGAR